MMSARPVAFIRITTIYHCHTPARWDHSRRMDMASTIWQEMSGSGAGIVLEAVITALAREVIRMDLLRTPTACCGAAVGTASPSARAVLVAPAARLTLAAPVSASVACVREVSQSGERSDKQARSGSAPVRREERAKTAKRSMQKVKMKVFIVPDI